MSHLNDLPGTKLTAAIAVIVATGIIADMGRLAVAPLAAQHYSVEMSSLFVGLLVVVTLFGWALLASFRIARSIHRTGDVVLNRGDSDKAVDNPNVYCPDEDADNTYAAAMPWGNLLRIEQMEAEQKDVQPRETAKLADQFQAAVGTLIGMGSLAERKPSRAFTKTAENTQSLDVMAPDHFETSASVRSVRAVHASSENQIAGPAQGMGNIPHVTQATGHVDDALTSIPAIAERTNAPALNAVIAAVRVAETGKGFAAVARQLMALAAQTAKVLEQLGVQIAETQATTHDPSAPSRTSRPASGEPDRAHRRSPERRKDRTRDAGDRPQRRTPRPRRRRSGLT